MKNSAAPMWLAACAGLTSTAACATALAQASFEVIPVLGSAPYRQAFIELSDSGDEMILNQTYHPFSSDWTGVRWRRGEGVSLLLDPGGSRMIAQKASRDCSTVYGRSEHSIGLGTVCSRPQRLSGWPDWITSDGSRGTTFSMVPPQNQYRALVWNNYAVAAIVAPLLPDHDYTQLYVITDDGSMALGRSGRRGTPSADIAIVWTPESGAQALPSTPAWGVPDFRGISRGGEIAIGNFNPHNEQFVWTPIRGFTIGPYVARLNGAGTFGAGGSGANGRAFWPVGLRWVPLEPILEQAGVNLQGWALASVSDISDDGLTLAGECSRSTPEGLEERVWVATLPCPYVFGPLAETNWGTELSEGRLCPGGAVTVRAAAATKSPFAWRWEVRPDRSDASWVNLVNGDLVLDGAPRRVRVESADSAAVVLVREGASDGGDLLLRATLESVCGTATTETIRIRICPSDVDCSGAVDGDDVILFFQQWDENDMGADFTGDGAVDGDDVIGFFGRWDLGC